MIGCFAGTGSIRAFCEIFDIADTDPVARQCAQSRLIFAPKTDSSAWAGRRALSLFYGNKQRRTARTAQPLHWLRAKTPAFPQV